MLPAESKCAEPGGYLNVSQDNVNFDDSAKSQDKWLSLRSWEGPMEAYECLHHLIQMLFSLWAVLDTPILSVSS